MSNNDPIEIKDIKTTSELSQEEMNEVKGGATSGGTTTTTSTITTGGGTTTPKTGVGGSNPT